MNSDFLSLFIKGTHLYWWEGTETRLEACCEGLSFISSPLTVLVQLFLSYSPSTQQEGAEEPIIQDEPSPLFHLSLCTGQHSTPTGSYTEPTVQEQNPDLAPGPLWAFLNRNHLGVVKTELHAPQTEAAALSAVYTVHFPSEGSSAHGLRLLHQKLPAQTSP